MVENPLVVVTGASGFLGSMTALYALKAGWRVRATVRALKPERYPTLAAARGPSGSAIEFVVAVLSAPQPWAPALKGATYVLHTASPLPTAKGVRVTEEDIVRPAVDGVAAIMAAAVAEASVKRVVLTS